MTQNPSDTAAAVEQALRLARFECKPLAATMTAAGCRARHLHSLALKRPDACSRCMSGVPLTLGDIAEARAIRWRKYPAARVNDEHNADLDQLELQLQAHPPSAWCIGCGTALDDLVDGERCPDCATQQRAKLAWEAEMVKKAKAPRRQFTDEFKQRIVREAAALPNGELTHYLEREGVSKSAFYKWRQRFSLGLAVEPSIDPERAARRADELKRSREAEMADDVDLDERYWPTDKVPPAPVDDQAEDSDSLFEVNITATIEFVGPRKMVEGLIAALRREW